ncbi:MAG: alpha/beta fold hydrolase [Elusimicrobiota bacterium]|jgi:pimeloyl-ACP methyl ester carboxylesterase
MNTLWTLLAAAAFAAGPAKTESVPSSRGVSFQTGDGLRIEADYLPARGGKPVLVLLHGVGASRREWDPFVGELAKKGFGALQVDARGHGGSGGPRSEAFRSEADWRALGADLDAALLWLKGRGVPEARVAFMGASIGANHALLAAARHPGTPFAVLLSPGLDYRGVRVEEAYRRFERPLFVAAAPEDAYAMGSCRTLAAGDGGKPRAARFVAGGSGHGAGLLSGEVNRPLVEELLRWLSERAASSRPPARRSSSVP